MFFLKLSFNFKKEKSDFFYINKIPFSNYKNKYDIQLTLMSRTRLTWISGWVEFWSKSRTSLCINIYNLTPVESNSDESKFRLSKHVYYLGLKIGSQLKHPVIDFVYNQKLSIHNKCRLGRQTSMIMKSTQRKHFIYWIICRKLILIQEDYNFSILRDLKKCYS